MIDHLICDCDGVLVDSEVIADRVMHETLVATFPGIAFDAILGAEFARVYKMQPDAYLRSCAAFDLPPGECLMCAAHERDLAVAAKVGLRTAFIHRPNEFGPGKGGPRPHEPVDLIVQSALELADALGA